MKYWLKPALAAFVALGASSAAASEEMNYDCGDASAGLNITIKMSPELGSTILNHNGRRISLAPDQDGVWYDPSQSSPARFYPADFPRNVIGSTPPVLLLGSEQFSCRVVVASNGSMKPGQFLNMTGRSLGGKLRAGPGTNYAQAGSTGLNSPLQIIRNTGVRFDGFDWFEVRTSAGQQAYQWGGIMCSNGSRITGIYEACAPTANPGSGGSSNGWMAFAIGNNGQFGHGAGQTRADAERFALQYCGDSSCRVDNLTQQSCQALVQASGGAWYGAGNNKQMAESTAQANCQSSVGGSCPVAYSYCRN